ncbi:hypothetical protein Zm00014a_042016 [Zea mays]|uniref:Uncharacterized protein n=1 Tax=Zea mays TaxID=4577 RepID=A0A3L6DRS9_MAIZE|nr:hypothetical protein Zm00014a_042016 [Zea mays]
MQLNRNQNYLSRIK